VVYDTSDFLETNRDVIPDDVVSVFSGDSCQFGFATHLFGNEIKALAITADRPTGPRGIRYCFYIYITALVQC
jgi:dachs protein